MIRKLALNTAISLAAGTTYLYGLYAPQLADKVGLSASDAATISVAVSVGSGLGGLPAGSVIDRFGSRSLIAAGSLCILLAYSTLTAVYAVEIRSVLLISVCMSLIGFGSVMTYFSCLKATHLDFPQSRGSAGSLPAAAYGLSATLYLTIAALFFAGNTFGLLVFLSAFCGPFTLAAAYFVPPHEHIQHTSDLNPLLHQQNRLWSSWFPLHYIIVAIAGGVGLMYIYSVGFVAKAQFYSHPSSGHLSSITAAQVSIYSITSFLGRLAAGVISDSVQKRQYQRQWVVVVTISLLMLSQFLLVLLDSLTALSVISGIVGFGYGMLNGVYPPIVSDEFGISTFTTIWGLICSGPLVVLFFFERYFGYVYDRHTGKGGFCAVGKWCYQAAFQLSGFSCLFALVVCAILLYFKQHASSLAINRD